MNRLSASFLLGWFVAVTAGCDRTVPVGSLSGSSCTEVGALAPAEDGCNTCTCGDDKIWACTEKACDACVPGITTYDGCNTCLCRSDGVQECTTKACNACTPGETKQDTVSGGECQNCTCQDDGTWSCESAECGAVCCLAEATCREGDTQISGQDACPAGASCYKNSICCSTVWCAPPVGECLSLPTCDEGQTQVTGACPVEGTCVEHTICGVTITCQDPNRCSENTPPIRAADGCNSCSCTADGTWACTDMSCAQLSCEEGQSKYQAYRATLLGTVTQGCTTDTDCTTQYENNHCAAGCGFAVPSADSERVYSELKTAGESMCAACPMPAVPPCLPLKAACVTGTCQMVGLN